MIKKFLSLIGIRKLSPDASGRKLVGWLMISVRQRFMTLQEFVLQASNT